MTHPYQKSGFSLIELMVTISIVSLLSSILTVALSSSRAKAYDAQTLALVRSAQTQLASMIEESGYPNTGNATTYYCLGKTAQESCTFWGESLYGHATLAEVNAQSNGPEITIDGEAYRGTVYKCSEWSEATGCTKAAIYWAVATHDDCRFGLAVITGTGGIICGQDAGSNTTNDVENAPGGNGGAFNFTTSGVAYEGEWLEVTSQGGQSSTPLTVPITLVSGDPQAVTVSAAYGLPAGVTIDFTSPTCTPNTECTVGFTVNTSGITGNVAITLAAVSADETVERTFDFELNVTAGGGLSLCDKHVFLSDFTGYVFLYVTSNDVECSTSTQWTCGLVATDSNLWDYAQRAIYTPAEDNVSPNTVLPQPPADVYMCSE